MNKPLSGMLPPKLGLTLAGLLAFTVSSHADTFGTGANTFTIEFVDISGGETADNTRFGAVAHDYRMGKYEVSGGMIDAYNADSGGPAITRLTEWSGSQPATGISWNEAARFVNWLNTSSGYSVAYKFTTDGGNDNIALWGAGDAGYNPANPFRNSNAYYVLPSEDEWYRAAYYDPNAGVYWDYETGSDTKPTAVEGGTSAGTAVYKTQAFLAMDPADIRRFRMGPMVVRGDRAGGRSASGRSELGGRSRAAG